MINILKFNVLWKKSRKYPRIFSIKFEEMCMGMKTLMHTTVIAVIEWHNQVILTHYFNLFFCSPAQRDINPILKFYAKKVIAVNKIILTSQYEIKPKFI